jgi:hypothetical protein
MRMHGAQYNSNDRYQSDFSTVTSNVKRTVNPRPSLTQTPRISLLIDHDSAVLVRGRVIALPKRQVYTGAPCGHQDDFSTTCTR